MQIEETKWMGAKSFGQLLHVMSKHVFCSHMTLCRQIFSTGFQWYSPESKSPVTHEKLGMLS